MTLYEGAVKRPIMTSLCFAAIIVFGVFSFAKLPIDLMPDIDTNSIMILTYYNGASAEDIENNVTRPLENSLNSVEHLKHITSQSRENVSVVTLEFEYGYDIDVLTNSVRDKLDMVSSALPDDAQTPILFKFSTDMIPILLLSVQAEESQKALYKILDENVANPLARIDGVGTVSISGAPEREINIYMDPQKMEAYGISPYQVSAAINAENHNVTNGTVDVGSQTFTVRVEGEFKDPKQMYDVVVGSKGGANVYLRDVARIVDDVEERAQRTFNNGQQGAMIVVQKQSGANSEHDAATAEKSPFRRQTRYHRQYVRQHQEHRRFSSGDHCLRHALCRSRGIHIPRTLACHTYHRHHNTDVVDCINDISICHRWFAQHDIAVVSLNRYR